MKKEKIYLESCRKIIEEKLNWGDSNSWQNQDFEMLSEQILAKTKISLSITTLKRIWGKVQYNSIPNQSTLNALAQFIEYDSWRAFQSSVFVKDEIEEIRKKKPIKKSSRQYYLISAGLFLIIAILCIFTLSKKREKPTSGKFHFSSKPVTLGLPNTVVFYYDAAKSTADSVFIQQDWDPQRRFKVDKQLHEATSTYYYPGFYKAKLVANNTIVKEHDLYIESNGWLGTVDNTPVPIYLTSNQNPKRVAGLSSAELKNLHVYAQNDIPWVSFFYVDKKAAIPSANFVMEAELKSSHYAENGACEQKKIILLGTQGIHMIPLSIKGCVGELDLVIANERISGATKDLSVFGTDRNKWVKVVFKIKNGVAKIFVNSQLAYHSNIKKNIGRIIGTRIMFKGGGEIKSYNLKE